MQAETESQQDVETSVEKFIQSLTFQSGEIDLKNGLAKLQLTDGFRYLSPKDAERVLSDFWGNPPSTHKTLGMIVPADVSLASEDSWAITITYEESGYVKDEDAGKIDYSDLLKQMKKDTAEASTERKKEGYPGISLVGWAAAPRYDAAEHKLYWAKELQFEGNEANTLNYNIRVLGRRGVLNLNVIAGINQLSHIEAQAPTVLSMVDFQSGHQYADFNPATDKVSEYGIAALVAGGAAAKMGLFKTIWAAILAGKKLVFIGAIALISVVAKLFGRK